MFQQFYTIQIFRNKTEAKQRNQPYGLPFFNMELGHIDYLLF
jgi:hypothetical protein